jgi:hypothetical protein
MGGRISAGAGARSAAATKWGQEPAGGWALEQQNRWNDEEKTRKAWAKEMKARVDKEMGELRHNPEAVSKKIVNAIGRMGVKTLIAPLWTRWATAKVVVYRSRTGTREGNEIFQDRALSEAVRKTGAGVRSQRV